MNQLVRLILTVALLGALPVQAALLVPAGSPNWRFKNGLAEASTPVTTWRGSNFNDAAFTSTYSVNNMALANKACRRSAARLPAIKPARCI